MTDWVKPGERVDDLQLKGLGIIQNPDGFCFGIDAVLLSNFCEVRPGDRVADLGTGTGIIPILVAGKSEAAHITAFEIQEAVADMAARSVAMNGLTDRITIVQDNLKNIANHITGGTVQVVTSNPPYVARGGGILNQQGAKAISRHEIHCTFEDVAQAAAYSLVTGGGFYVIHRPDRMADVLIACRNHGLEPKRLRLIQPKHETAPNLFLLKCVKGGKPELRFDAPLVVYNHDGDYTEEIHDIYKNERIDVFGK